MNTNSASTATDGFPPLALVAIAFIVFWLQLLGHEVAHDLGRDLFTGTADLSKRWPRRVQLAYFAAGPLFTLALLFLAAAIAAQSRGMRTRIVAVALALSTGSRFALVFPGTLLGHASDERALSAFLHVPLPVLGIAELALVIAALAPTVRSLPRNTRPRVLGWMTIAIVAGLFAALTIGNALGIPVGTLG